MTRKLARQAPPGSRDPLGGPEKLAQRITKNVSAAIIVHAAGYASEIDKIVEIAHAHGIKIIEDCSQSHFAKHKAKPVGTFGDIAAFSTIRKRRT